MTKTLAIVLVLAACGDDGGMTVEPEIDAAPPLPDASATVRIGGFVRDLDLTKPVTPTDQRALANVEICSVIAGEQRTCVTTATDGRWSLELPRNRKGVGLTHTIAGYTPMYHLFATLDMDEDDGTGTMYMPRDADAQAFFTSCGAAYPLDASRVGIAMAGFRHVAPEYIKLDGATASATAGDGPCYMSGPWVHGSGQLTTTTAGFGYALFGDIDPAADAIDVTIDLNGATCAASRDALPLVGDNTIRFPLMPGYLTHASVVCE